MCLRIDITCYNGNVQGVQRPLSPSALPQRDYAMSTHINCCKSAWCWSLLCSLQRISFEQCFRPLLAWLAIVQACYFLDLRATSSLISWILQSWPWVMLCCHWESRAWLLVLHFVADCWLLTLSQRCLETQAGYWTDTTWSTLLHHCCHCWSSSTMLCQCNLCTGRVPVYSPSICHYRNHVQDDHLHLRRFPH